LEKDERQHTGTVERENNLVLDRKTRAWRRSKRSPVRGERKCNFFRRSTGHQ